jgi:RNA polymerase sigma-32 factor
MSTVATLPFVFSEGGLPRYLSEIQKFPLLTASQEVTYAKRWREHGDREAAYISSQVTFGWPPRSR